MISYKGGKRLRKTEYSRRWLAMLLCLSMVMSLIGGVIVFPTSAAKNETTTSQTGSSTVQKEETRKEIKSRLLRQIKEEDWDPYSTDMTLDEFYALMQLFEEGKLPLKSSGAQSSPILGAPGMDEPGIEEPSTYADELYIPRTMFMFSGLDNYTGETNKPLDYDNDNSTDSDYPPGLDKYRQGYKLPPADWQGVPLKDTNGTEALVIVPDANKDNPSVAGDVDQSLFLQYDGHYVRRVTAENAEVSILGAIKLSGSDNYVYYYLTNDSQEHDVSTTTLPEGQKFIVEYSTSEHLVSYDLRMNSVSGSTNLPDGITLNTIFGADRPTKTDDGKYAFTATVPYGYTLELYLVKVKEEDETTKGSPIKQLGLNVKGNYTEVNEGWALGMDPDYKNGTENNGTVQPNTSNGPSTLTMSGTFYNNEVKHDRTVIGVLKKKAAPRFLFAPLAHGSNNVKGRGSAIKSEVDYNWEEDFATNGSKYPSREGGFPNLPSTLLDGGWQWNNSTYKDYKNMKQEDDGTYSFTFLFQTNSGDDYVLDTLAVNGVSITIPFFPKEIYNNTNYTKAVTTNQWCTETTLPDGTIVKVEHLLVFGDAQHHYRITVTNARSDVIITGMNLMQYRNGASEFAVYQLNGVVAGDSQTTAVEYYNGSEWTTTYLASINVRPDFTGDSSKNSATFRFKLADGYDSPYFLWESTRAGAIKDHGSATRDTKTNEVTKWNAVENLPSEGTMDTQHIYGPDEDGYYYFRVSTQDPYKIALLTVVARPVRYVVRYVPSYKAVGETAPTDEENTVGIIDNPENMPQFEHFESICHESFFDTTNKIPGEQYDDKNGQYYDTAIDSVVILPSNSPTDPNNQYVFVDWVLVDQNYDPVTNDNGEEFHYRGSNITLADINQYAIPNESLGGDETDIYVLRLMPTWREIKNPFNYKVALNWVDATGELHEEYFDEFWQEVLTDWDIKNGGLTVKVLTDATPFLDWIAQHPTYTFWDAVNNNNALYRYASEHNGVVDDTGRAAMRAEMEKAINDYLPALSEAENKDQYEKVLQALCKRDISGKGSVDNKGNDHDDFWRLGGYAFQVFEDEGTIVVWMYENKGGLVFHKDVQEESFIYDDEFYFTVSHVQVGDVQELNGTYKAYPEQAYDDNGKPRNTLDKDAWLVTFKNGKITSIVKNDGSAAPVDPVTFFTLKDGEGIKLYIPDGEYTITELGSKSGGSYKVDVEYDGENEPGDGSSWTLPEGDLWLKGRETTYYDPEDSNYPEDVSQVSATVKFEVGEYNVVHTLIFYNQTSTLAIENDVQSDGDTQDFEFKAEIILPKGVEPLKDTNASNKDYYYFNYNRYDVEYGQNESVGIKPSDAGEGWKPRGTTTPIDTGRIVMEKVDSLSGDPEGSTRWKAVSLLIQPEQEDDDSYDWSKAEKADIKLKHRQRLYIVITTPEQNGAEINYEVEEINIPKPYRVRGLNPKSSYVKAGELAYELFINDQQSELPTTGGIGSLLLRLAGSAILFVVLPAVYLLTRRKRYYPNDVKF